MNEISEIFDKMSSTITSKLTYHEEHQALYDGTHKADTIKVSQDPKINRIAKGSLGWPKISIDYLASDCRFDAFKADDYDDKGLTRLLVEAGGDAAINSAVTNSMIGSVAFVAIIPRDEELPILVPFSGSEATGIKTARGDKLAYGLAIKKRNDAGIVEEWYFFSPGFIDILDSNGEVIDSVDLGIEAMPFIQFSYGEDMASRPFGRSRITPDCRDALDSALRGKTTSEQVNYINSKNGAIIIAAGEPGVLDGEEFTSDASSLPIIYYNGTSLDGIRKEHLEQIKLNDIRENIESCLVQFAASSFVPASAYGYYPSNGTNSEGTSKELNKPYENLKETSRESYARSIKTLALELYRIVTQNYDIQELMYVEVVFREQSQTASVGSYGDSMLKVVSLFKDAENGAAMIQEILEDVPAKMRELMGTPIRPKVLRNELPDTNRSISRFRDTTLNSI